MTSTAEENNKYRNLLGFFKMIEAKLFNGKHLLFNLEFLLVYIKVHLPVVYEH